MAGHTGGIDRAVAVAIVLLLVLVYNSNGREIGSYDSQPTKFAARELLRRGTLSLNHVVGAVPAYSDRPSFVLSRDGRYRSAYSPVPAVLAASIAYPLVKLRLLDLASPAAPAIIAVTGASLLTAIAVALLYLAARRRLPRARAVLLAAGLGLGTGLWPLVSRTLWAHETAILGMAIAVAAFWTTEDRLSGRAAICAALGLALAGLARPQLAPMIAVMLAGICARASRRAAIAAIGIVATAAAAMMLINWQWFGAPFGAQTVLQATTNSLHGTSGWFTWGIEGHAGLLISPSRGLLVFSPVVAIALAGFADAVRSPWTSPLRWCAAAGFAQFLLYGGYVIWWGGHTYGPRYMLDVLPVLVPLAAAALSGRTLGQRASVGGRRTGRLRAVLCFAALAWSIGLAATGAFCYPSEQWNTTPIDVDREHSRLWSWTDSQFLRCWKSGPSPRNLDLLALTSEPRSR
jgi:hypothetical protein